MKHAKTAGFRFLPSYYEATRGLSDPDRLALYDAILDYGFGNEVGELPLLLSGFFTLILPTLERSIRFEQKQRENGAKGGRPEKPSESTMEECENPNEKEENPDECDPRSGENLDVELDVDLDLDHDIDIEKDLEGEGEREGAGKGRRKKRAERFTPPSSEEVREYCQSRRNAVDPQRFVDFYTAKGWRIGREVMKDWKAAVRTWERKEGHDGRDHGSRREDTAIPGILRL